MASPRVIHRKKRESSAAGGKGGKGKREVDQAKPPEKPKSNFHEIIHSES